MSVSKTWRAGRRLLFAACLLASLLIPSAQATPGALDPSFGTGGKVTTPIGSASGANALVTQPDGKLVAAGNAYNGSNWVFALARYNANGSLDSSFGSGGKVTTALGIIDFAYGLALQPDGKLVAAGYSCCAAGVDFGLARYNANGSLDTSFNGAGKVTTSFGPGNDAAQGVVLQPNGKVVAAGYGTSGSQTVFALARYNANGSLDTTFNGTGKVTTPIGSADDEANAVALQPDGKIVAVGKSSNAGIYRFALVRYNPDGSLDTSFNGTGKVTTAIGSGNDDGSAVVLQPDGRIVAAGYSNNGTNDDFALVRYKPDGTLDTGFGSGGKLTTPIGSGSDRAQALALQTDGKLVAAGSGHVGSTDDFALVRYLGSTLTVARAGSGSGSVSSSPSGISCGSSCSAPFAAVPVTLTATPSPGSSFLGWSGSCSGTGPCTVTMGGDRTATARFESDKTLTLAKSGSGAGTVSSNPAGISCGSGCSHSFTYGTPVTLTATAAAGSSFLGWSGACSGTGTCTLTMSGDQTATATFERDKTLTLAKTGTGAGTVSSNPAGISCGSTCAHAFRHGTAVTLTAVASARSRFAGWSGACSGTGSCTVTMSAARSVTATFKPLCVVPKLKGKTLKAAKRALKRAHCSVGKVTGAYSAKVKKGRVTSQKPKPGKKLAAGSKVKLTISKGKKA